MSAGKYIRITMNERVGGKYFFIFQSIKERDMRQLNTLPVGELIPAKPAFPVNVTNAQTIGQCFSGDSLHLGLGVISMDHT